MNTIASLRVWMEIENLLNQPGYNTCGNNGSVRDYFSDARQQASLLRLLEIECFSTKLLKSIFPAKLFLRDNMLHAADTAFEVVEFAFYAMNCPAAGK